MQNKRTVTYLLAAAAVLLVVIVALVVFRAQPSTGTDSGTGTAGTGTTTPPANMGGAPPANIPFDPATATKVPDGQSPKQFVEAYFKAVIAKEYTKAWEMLPASKKAAQDAASFEAQLAGYGLTSYKMGEATEEGDTATVNGSVSGSGTDIEYLWTFAKVDGKWLVKSRTLPGMGTP